MTKKDINIIDLTVRRGGFLVHNHLLKEQVADIAKGIEAAGVEYMELSHGRGIGAKRAGYPAIFSDHELLEAARRAAPKIKFTAFVSPYPYSIFELEKVRPYCEWFRLSVDLDDMQKAVENLKAIGNVRGHAIALLERAHRISPKECAEAAKKLTDAGAEVIYLCDNFSSMNEEDVLTYLGKIREKTSATLGFQGYNATSQAVGNSLAALQAGVEWLDGSLLGLGPSGGMTPLEILALLLPRLEYPSLLNVQQLCRAGRWYALPAVRRLPSVQRIDLLMSRIKLDYYPLELLERLADILEMDLLTILEEIDRQNPNRIRLKEADLRQFLEGHKLDFDVVLQFIKTGEIPEAAAAN